MKSLIRAAAVAALFTVPVAAVAFSPGESPDIASVLAQKLDIETELATELAGVLKDARAEQQELEAALQTEAEALKAARDAGDVRAMKKGIAALQDTRDALQDLEGATEDTILKRLTVEQQADFALMRLQRVAKRRKALDALQQRRGDEIPAFEP